MAETTGVFREYGVTGLPFMSGMVLADPEAQMQGKRGAEQYDLMRHEDSTVAALLLALTLPIRQARWRVHPASSKPTDIEAAEFVESVMHDMSHSWDDFLTEVSTMFAFGWSYMEWVLKRRQGDRKLTSGAKSKYNDGLVGFRKIVLRAQTSLYEWDLDDAGGINGMWQATLNQPRPVLIPLKKAILFRTTRERNDPEGLSILRPAWRDWKYKRNLERIEAIGLQRALQGLPVVSLSQGATTTASAGQSSHEAKALAIIQGLHSNKLLGVIEEKDTLELEFKHPKMTGVTADSDRVIKRKDESIVRTALAMYILLGSRERGSYALAKELGELFFLAVDGFLGIITQTFNRFALPILFRYNAWPGLEGYPEVTANVNRGVDLDRLATFINKMVMSQVLTPDEELERYLRDLADFPPAAVQVGQQVPEPVTPQEPPEAGEKPTGAQVEEARREQFSQGGSSRYDRATDAYERELRTTYLGWTEEAITELMRIPAGTDPNIVRRHWRELVLAGLLLLKRRGWERFPEAFALGYNSRALGPEMRAIIEEEIVANDRWLETKLFRRVELSLLSLLDDALALAWSGREAEARERLEDTLRSLRGNVGQYAGHFWRMIFMGAAQRIREEERQQGTRIRVEWVMDALAEHCAECPVFAREYESMDDLLAHTGGILPGQGTECDGHCRCRIYRQTQSGWALA